MAILRHRVLPSSARQNLGSGIDAHRSDIESTVFRRALNHTMHLVSQVYLACSRTTSIGRANTYRESIVAYLRDLPFTYPISRKHSFQAEFSCGCPYL